MLHYLSKLITASKRKRCATTFINITSRNIFDNSGSVVKPKLFIPILVPTLERFRVRFQIQTMISTVFFKLIFFLQTLSFLLLEAALLPRSCHIILWFIDCLDFCHSTLCRIRIQIRIRNAFRIRAGPPRQKVPVPAVPVPQHWVLVNHLLMPVPAIPCLLLFTLFKRKPMGQIWIPEDLGYVLFRFPNPIQIEIPLVLFQSKFVAVSSCKIK